MNKKLNFKNLSVHESPKLSPGLLLWHVSTSWRNSIESVLKPLNLTHPQFVVLAATGWLTRNGDHVTQVTIGNMAGLDPNTNSQIIKGLETKGLIRRVQSSDSRANNVSLTTTGTQLLSHALPLVEKADANFFSNLNKNELQQLIQSFQKLTPKINSL